MTKRLSSENWKLLDTRIKREDEDRWLSSRYASNSERRKLVALYALNLELAKVRTIVSEPGLGAIRFQWWRDVAGEIAAGGPVREHDVAQAIWEVELSGKTILGLIDGHEAAFEATDRALEPEALLMRAAVVTLVSAHAWGEHIAPLAEAYAAARRGDTNDAGPALPKVPNSLRPAVSHAILRLSYADSKRPGPLSKRLKLMHAMRTGRV